MKNMIADTSYEELESNHKKPGILSIIKIGSFSDKKPLIRLNSIIRNTHQNLETKLNVSYTK